MPPSGSGSARRASVESLIRDLGSQVRRAETPREDVQRWPTGFQDLDRLLQGGFPAGRIGEITGPLSSGRTSLVLALLDSLTGRGDRVALVDAADAFDPRCAVEAGVELGRTLWVRPPPTMREPALRSAEILLRAGGFALVVLDFSRGTERPPASAHWLRLTRSAQATRTSLVVVTSGQRLAGSHAELALETRPLVPRFVEGPRLLEAAETELRLVRHRSGPEGRVRVRLHTAPP